MRIDLTSHRKGTFDVPFVILACNDDWRKILIALRIPRTGEENGANLRERLLAADWPVLLQNDERRCTDVLADILDMPIIQS